MFSVKTLCSLWETYTKKIFGEDRMFKFILTGYIDSALSGAEYDESIAIGKKNEKSGIFFK